MNDTSLLMENKMTMLSRRLNSMMGENIGEFMLNSELKRLKKERQDLNNSDFALLAENLKQSFELVVGKNNAQCFYDDITKELVC
jgi:hypothetical protein